LSLTNPRDAGTSTSWVVRLDVYAEETLTSIASRGVKVYTLLSNRDGHHVIYAKLPPLAMEALTRNGVRVTLLEVLHPLEPYFLLAPPPTGSHPDLNASVKVLDTDKRHLFIRAPFEDAEKLASLGYQIRRVTPHPFMIEGDLHRDLLLEISTPAPDVRKLIESISEETAHQYIGDLSGEWPVTVNGNPYTILTRYSLTKIPIKKATRYTFEHFQALGLNPYYFHYDLPGYGEKRNVVAEQAGQLEPEGIVLIVGHLDSTSTDPYNLAPGADDNASGSAGLMQAADVLSKASFDYTIRYVLFTGEEQGLYGSEAYAKHLFDLGEKILAVINVDMIGTDNDQVPVMDVHIRQGNPNDLAIADLLTTVIDLYQLDLIPETVQYSYLWSDHIPFWEFGYPAIMSTEDYDDHSPYYHTTGDRLSTLNLNYNAEVLRAVVGVVAHLARPSRPYSAYLPLNIHNFPVGTSELNP